MANAGIALGSVWAVVFLAAFVIPGLETTDNADEFDGRERAIARTVDHVERAFAEDRGDEACAELFTTAFARKVARGSGQTCAQAVDGAIDEGQVQAVIRIDRIVISDGVARAAVREGDEKQTWRLRRVGAAWRVDAIDTGR